MKKNYRGLLLTGLFGLLVMGLLGCNNSEFNSKQTINDAKPKPSIIPSVIPSIIPSPSPIPTGMKDFTLKDLNNQNVTLSSFLGKKILLNFSGSHCGPCIREFPVLQELHDKQLKDVVVLVVCYGKNLDEVKNVVGKYTFKSLYAINLEVFNLYAVDGTPTNVYLNRQGQEVKREDGFGGQTVDYYINILNKIP